MKMKSIVGAICCFFLIALALPVIATPPDSPPTAQAAKEDTNAIECFNPTLIEYGAPDIIGGESFMVFARCPLVISDNGDPKHRYPKSISRVSGVNTGNIIAPTGDH